VHQVRKQHLLNRLNLMFEPKGTFFHALYVEILCIYRCVRGVKFGSWDPGYLGRAD
jgi:hypothetical protein